MKIKRRLRIAILCCLTLALVIVNIKTPQVNKLTAASRGTAVLHRGFYKTAAPFADKGPHCNDRPVDPGVDREWFWLDGFGCHRTAQDLQAIFVEHQSWLNSGKRVGRRADFIGADLAWADLSGMDLREVSFCPNPGPITSIHCANLSQANLQNTKLNGVNLFAAILVNAELEDADLEGVVMAGANLTNAILYDADLRGAQLKNAVLTKAALSRANLSGVFLEFARLDGANLADVELRDADVAFVDLTDAIFEPKSNPNTREMASADGLQSLKYDDNPDALFQLRKQFEDNGFTQKAREITYALMRTDAAHHRNDCHLRTTFRDCMAFAFNTVFFDWTSLYGMHPGRPLLLLGAGWFLLAFVYLLSMHLHGPSGIYMIVERRLGSRDYIHRIRIRSRPLHQGTFWKYPIFWLAREWRLLRTSMFFSLASAFNLGYRELNVGQWLKMLTTREYDLKPVRWVRTIVGLQSLFSLYMVILWVLTYFGHPFE